jgi:uncharacterized membrane protein YheB (UPF0754 family)
MNKSIITNIIASLLFIIPFFGPEFCYREIFYTMGLFAFSGGMTNWIAIHMLFEKVPGFYGSGIIPARFESFKGGIRNLILNNFFTEENFKKFTSEKMITGFQPEKLVELLDFDHLFKGLMVAIQNSKLGPMLSMFGGEGALEKLQEPFTNEVHKRLITMVQSDSFKNALASGQNFSDLRSKVEHLVDSRLEELTPEMVKNIIQKMIRRHLGWLVVWGGVFGGLIGLITSIIKTA